MENKYQRIIIQNCVAFSEKIMSLFEYYKMSEQALDNYVKAKVKEYKYGLKIDSILSKIFDFKTQEERNQYIYDLGEKSLFGKRKVKDLISDIKYNDESGNIVFAMDFKYLGEKSYDPNEAKKVINTCYSIEEAVELSILTNSITIFEQFLTEIYTILIKYNLEKYFCSSTVQIKELINISNIGSFINDKAEELAESDMYNSVETLEKIIEKEKIDISRISETFSKFKEIYFRRNVWVHNDGFANSRYIKEVCANNIKVDDYLKCDERYVAEVVDIIQELMFYISFSLVSKYKIHEEEYEIIEDFYFQKLRNKEYSVTEFVNKELSQCRKIEIQHRMVSEVNYLISLKESGKKNEFEKEISTFDVSAADDSFKIAKAALLEDYESVYEMIEDNYKSPISSYQLRDWPLYLHFRESEQYKKIVEAHKGDFNIKELNEESDNL